MRLWLINSFVKRWKIKQSCKKTSLMFGIMISCIRNLYILQNMIVDSIRRCDCKIEEMSVRTKHFATFLSIRAQKRSNPEPDMGKRLITETELSWAERARRRTRCQISINDNRYLPETEFQTILRLNGTYLIPYDLAQRIINASFEASRKNENSMKTFFLCWIFQIRKN